MNFTEDDVLHIGIDDTDSHRAGCTTYVASLLTGELLKAGAIFVDFPNIVRLNPNVPWKTRGNGAVCLRVLHDDVDAVRELAAKVVERNAELGSYGTDPGVVLHKGRVTNDMEAFSHKAVKEIVSFKEAIKLINKHGCTFMKFKEGRGVVGALAAIGERLLGDHTFEIIAYRSLVNRGTPRKVDMESVLQMNQETFPLTFNNVDLEKRRALITPHGPDPILYGIRGESLEVVKEAFNMVKPLEEVERWTIFRTNHGTDAHLRRVKKIQSIKPYTSVILRGTVSSNPTVIAGGHVIFQLRNGDEEVDCAAYEPTGFLNKVVRKLIEGDRIEVYGSVKSSSTWRGCVNLEKIRVLQLTPLRVHENPRCPNCGKRMGSLGTGKGLRCKRCRLRLPNAKKSTKELPRMLKNIVYIASPRAHRHLTKPYSRYGREKSTTFSLKHLDPAIFYWSRTSKIESFTNSKE